MLKRLHNSLALPAIEQRAALLAGKHITYTLKRSSKRRSIGLLVDGRGLIVSVPERASEKWVCSVLQDKARWVVEKLESWQMRQPVKPHWVDGGAIDYLGDLLTLRVARSLCCAPAQRRGEELWLSVANDHDTAHVEQAVSRWYRHEAGQLFAERIARYRPMLNVAPRALKLSSAKTQWGCCTTRGTVHLNVQLIKLPLRLIDYVVVHELAHLREMNHSAAFWAVVESVCPEYTKLRNELKAVAL